MGSFSYSQTNMATMVATAPRPFQALFMPLIDEL